MNSTPERVCAVVVTFNRKQLLRESLDALMAQTRPLDAIVVINNASTDGTAEMLASGYSHLNIMNLERNTGGAGGFRAGMDWAVAHGYDWMWVMDDDVEPYPFALETMLGFGGISHFINPHRETSGGPFRWDSVWDLSSALSVRYSTEQCFRNAAREWVPVTVGNFEGALIHRDVVERIGLPDERFFMMGDDAIYGFLAHFHTNVIYLRKITAIRKLQPGVAGSWRQMFFNFRNRFLLREYLVKAGLPVNRVVFWIRILYDALYWSREALSGRTGPRWASLRAICGGIADGVRGRFGVPGFIR